MKARAFCVIFVSLTVAASQPSLAQTYWQRSADVAPVLSYSSSESASVPSYHQGFECQAPDNCCAVAPTCIPIPQVREETITETICVPETVMEQRTIQEQRVRYEQRPRTVTVYDQVPRVVNVNDTVTVMTQETRMQPVTKTGYQAVTRNVVTPVTVAVPGVENRIGIRQMVQTVPVTVQRVVTTQCVCTQTSPGMAPVQIPCPPTQRIVQQVVNQQRVFNQQYTYQVPVTRQQIQYQTRQIVDYKPVTQTVNVPVAVQVPRQQLRTRQVTQMTTVPRQVVTYEKVAVPHTVTRQISVPVTRYVKKTICKTIQVPVNNGCSTCY